MKIVVTGSRGWTDANEIRMALRYVRECARMTDDPHVLLVHGGARGADMMAENIAMELGGFSVKKVPALWEKYGKSAGYRRNVQMLDDYEPEIVLAFCLDGSAGTMHTVNAARSRRIPVNLYERWTPESPTS